MSTVDDLLDATLDDLDDLPVFEPFHPGVHKVLCTMELKEVDKHGKCPELSMKLIETVELANPQDAVQEAGSETSVLFMLDNQMGQGKFKELAGIFKTALNFEGSNRELIEAITDIECIVVSKVRKDKSDPDRLYMDIKELAVV